MTKEFKKNGVPHRLIFCAGYNTMQKMNSKILFSFILLTGLTVSSAIAEGKTPSVHDVSPKKALDARGKYVYDTFCVGCHGIKGDGKGPASEFLNPKPRDFVSAQYKFTSGPSGSLPTDEDLLRTVTNGLHGTSMPSWKLLPEDDRKAVIQYIKKFSEERWKNEPNPAVTAISEDPFVGNEEEGIKQGEKAYHGFASCISCHAAYISPEKINEARVSYGMGAEAAFRENLYRAVAKEAFDGTVVVPPDFTYDHIKTGTDLKSLYRAVANGISGTAMPTWKGVLAEEDLWGIAYYVRHLAQSKPKVVTPQWLREREEKLKSMEAARITFEEKMKQEAAAAQAAEAAAKAAAAAAPTEAPKPAEGAAAS